MSIAFPLLLSLYQCEPYSVDESRVLVFVSYFSSFNLLNFFLLSNTSGNSECFTSLW